MAGQSNAAPVIIKRKKNIIAGGHHGGAWKVAYADFVTAMMAFFLLMWLLNATTEKQRKGLADYFSPSIPVTRVSGGGDGSFGGDSIMSEATLIHNGTGATARAPEQPSSAATPSQEDAASRQAEEEMLAEVEKALLAKSGESMTLDRLRRHVVTKLTDEGLVIELFDLPGAELFQTDKDEPNGILIELATMLAETLEVTPNRIAISAHVKSYPVMLIRNPVWELSAQRAQRTRALLTDAGVDAGRMARITGHADRSHSVQNASAIENNRLEVIVLRNGK